MNEKKLILEKPILSTWSSESHLMSMILTQKNSIQWIFNNYMNLLGYNNTQKNQNLLAFCPKHDPTDHDVALNAWSACPFLDVHYVSPDYIRQKYKNVLEYIICAIEDGYYIYLSLSQENLKTRMGTNIHKTFIYGFDKKERKIYVADHYNVGKYSLAEIEFCDFIKAYNNAYHSESMCFNNLFRKNEKCLYDKQAVVIARPKTAEYIFNLDWFKIQLIDYLESRYNLNCVVPFNTSENNKMYFGISCYNLIIEYMDRLLENIEFVKDDWRIFTLLCDHKKIMKMRMEFFHSQGICLVSKKEMEGYDILVNTSKKTLHLFLKYIVSKNSKCLYRIKENILDMKQLEYELLQQLLKKLNS